MGKRRRVLLCAKTLILGLKLDRDVLYERVMREVDDMLVLAGDGCAAYVWLGCEALKGIGYIEWREYFAGTQTVAEIGSE